MAFGKMERDLCHSAWLSAAGAAENYVGHLAASQTFGTLAAQNPFNGIDNVALAAAVGSYQGRDGLVELKFCFIRKTFKSIDDNLFQFHPFSSVFYNFYRVYPYLMMALFCYYRSLCVKFCKKEPACVIGPAWKSALTS